MNATLKSAGTCATLSLAFAVSAAAQGADECVNATAISGLGSFPFTNVGATESGVTGLVCSGSVGAGNDRCPDDVWFVWTAPSSGSFRVATCGTSPVLDSKLVVWDGDDCVTSMPLECNDDAPNCANFSSEVFVSGIISGQSYLIEIGAWAGVNSGLGPWPQGAGSVVIDQMPPPNAPANDDCANATPIAGLGSFPWDNNNASTDGLAGTICDPSNNGNVNSDVWFRWTSPGTGLFTFETCITTALDTRLRAYDDQPCPAMNSLACDDDGCTGTMQSQISFNANTGVDYLIRVGSWGASAQGSGDLLVTGGPTVIGTNYCIALANSSGSAGAISAAGSTSVSAQTLALEATGLPSGVSGIVYYGTTQIAVPFGDGFRCVGGTVQRLPLNAADANGVLRVDDVYAHPMPNVAIVPGTLNFQGWFRDPPAMNTGFNLTDGVSITFVP